MLDMRLLGSPGKCPTKQARNPIQVGPYPQKLSKLYAFHDSGIPIKVRSALSTEPFTEQSGWHIQENAVIQGETRYSFNEGLPVGRLNALAIAKDGVVWIGSAEGLVRFQPNAAPEDRWQYFASRRYLPDDHVINIVPDDESGVWVKTQTGVSHIQLLPMTLREKADYFEERICARHDRYGMVADSILREPGNLDSNLPCPNDNDGLWTAIYVGAECFRYAVTKDPESLVRARKSTEALLKLEEITGIPGFPARSYRLKGEWRPEDGEWHWLPDGSAEWKGDTSSDEIVGHYFGLALAYDLLPDKDLKDRIRSTITRITDHILDNGYYLIDVDGKPTTWGRWSPEYFKTDIGRPDAPLNAIELLSFVKTAIHITGKERYQKEYRKLIDEMHYDRLGTRYLELREVINYSDEELAMLSFYLLFRYEEDPKQREIYAEAMEQWWENEKLEKNPLWSFIYGCALPKRDVDLGGAVWTLNRIPMDLISWTIRNSHRKDIEIVEIYHRNRQIPISTRLLPPDERRVMKWNSSPFILDGGNGGQNEDDGAFFLLPYWMGRYYGLISEENVELGPCSMAQPD